MITKKLVTFNERAQKCWDKWSEGLEILHVFTEDDQDEYVVYNIIAMLHSSLGNDLYFCRLFPLGGLQKTYAISVDREIPLDRRGSPTELYREKMSEVSQ